MKSAQSIQVVCHACFFFLHSYWNSQRFLHRDVLVLNRLSHFALGSKFVFHRRWSQLTANKAHKQDYVTTPLPKRLRNLRYQEAAIQGNGISLPPFAAFPPEGFGKPVESNQQQQQQPQQQLKTKTKMLNAVCGMALARCGTVKQNDRFFFFFANRSRVYLCLGLARRSDQATGSARWLTVNTPWVLMDFLCWICRFRQIRDGYYFYNQCTQQPNSMKSI